MVGKVIKLILLLCFFNFNWVFAQTKTNADSAVVSQYNKWLKVIQLNELIKADTYAPVTTTTKSVNQVYVLYLSPTAKYQAAATAAGIWSYIKTGLAEKNIDIYTLMFMNLANITQQPLNKLRIEIKSKKPHVFSAQVFFNSGIDYTEVLNPAMGGELNLHYNFAAAGINLALSKTYTLKPPMRELKNYKREIVSFFNRHKPAEGKIIRIDTIMMMNHIMRLKIFNVQGYITPNYHEIIEITIFLDQQKNRQIKAGYFATVRYGGGIYKGPANEFDYEDLAAEPELNKHLQNYNRQLDTAFRKIFHVTN